MPKPTNGDKKSVTLGDVAKHAGVSRSTASLVVRNSSLIKAETHKKVRKSMKKLGYVYNHSAASLRTRTTKTLGMIIADISNPFYAELASGIQATCRDKNYLTIFADTQEDWQQQELIVNQLTEHNVAGVFLCPAGRGSLTDIKSLEDAGIPTVLIMRYVDGDFSSYVGPDNIEGMKQIVAHLAEQGCRRIAFIGGPPRRSSSIDRLAGFKLGMERAGLEIDADLITSCDIDRKSAMDACDELLNNPRQPDAIACYNDIMAFGSMLSLTKKNIVAGKDIAVTGFDNIPESSLWTPDLTTVSIDAANIGRLAAIELLDHIDDPTRTKQKIIVQPKLVVRGSSNFER